MPLIKLFVMVKVASRSHNQEQRPNLNVSFQKKLLKQLFRNLLSPKFLIQYSTCSISMHSQIFNQKK